MTCEDAVELQLQQPHVVRLETRPQSRGEGQITMRDLVREEVTPRIFPQMRPERIIVGEFVSSWVSVSIPIKALRLCGEVYSVGSACPLSRRIAPPLEMSIS